MSFFYVLKCLPHSPKKAVYNLVCLQTQALVVEYFSLRFSFFLSSEKSAGSTTVTKPPCTSLCIHQRHCLMPRTQECHHLFISLFIYLSPCSPVRYLDDAQIFVPVHKHMNVWMPPLHIADTSSGQILRKGNKWGHVRIDILRASERSQTINKMPIYSLPMFLHHLHSHNNNELC